jgi:DDE superfamily endonuclease
MWVMIASLQPLVEDLRPAFTLPSFASACDLLLSWVMCLGKHTLRRVAQTRTPDRVPDHSQRHGLDTTYNFFERSAWSPPVLARLVAILVFARLKLGGRITLLVDDTLAHKRGKSVWGLGWFRDAVASTRKRVATASGHNWVVVAAAVCLPFSDIPILACPLLARLHRPGKTQPSGVDLARQMLTDILAWFPNRTFTLVGDGAYASRGLLANLDERVVFVGRMRGDAAVYDPRVPRTSTKQRGRKPTKGPRLPSPKAAAAKADRKRTTTGDWVWRKVEVTVYGCQRTLWAFAYLVVWPRVLGLRPVRVVVVRDPDGTMDDIYLFTTDVQADLGWVITQFAWRWSIEVLFRSSKQVLQIEAPQHWCQASVAKVAPWVWSVQSVIMVWYVTAGRDLAEAVAWRERLGEWDSEWSLRHMVRVLREVILNATISPNSANEAQLREMVQTLKNWANLAA